MARREVVFLRPVSVIMCVLDGLYWTGHPFLCSLPDIPYHLPQFIHTRHSHAHPFADIVCRPRFPRKKEKSSSPPQPSPKSQPTMASPPHHSAHSAQPWRTDGQSMMKTRGAAAHLKKKNSLCEEYTGSSGSLRRKTNWHRDCKSTNFRKWMVWIMRRRTGWLRMGAGSALLTVGGDA